MATLRRLSEKSSLDYASTLKETLQQILQQPEVVNSSFPLKKQLEDAVSNVDNYLCIKIDTLEEHVSRIYNKSYLNINKHELETLRKYLTGKEKPEWPLKCSRDEELSIYEDTRERAWLVKWSDTAVIVSNRDIGLDERNFYAHAGLAYGTDYIAVQREDLILCLGSYAKVLEIIKRRK